MTPGQTTGKSCAALAGMLAMALVPAAAWAEETAERLDALTIVATKTFQDWIDTLAPVSVVREDTLKLTGPNRVSDVLFGVPGVNVQESGDSPQSGINIRGLQNFGRVAVIVDGARQNFAQLNHDSAGSFFIEPGLLAGADIVRGPTANIYGSGAIGGVASFRTKDTQDILRPGERWGVEGSGELGSNGPAGFGSLLGATRLGDKVDLLVGGSWRDRGNYRDGDGNTVPNTGLRTWTGMAKATIRPADTHEIKLSALNFDSKYRTTPSVEANTTTPPSQYETHTVNQTATAAWRHADPDRPLVDVATSVYWNRTKLDQDKVCCGNSAVSGPVGAERDFQIDTAGLDLNNTSRFGLGPVRNALTYGGDYFHDRVENQDRLGFSDGFNPSGQRGVGGAFLQWQADYSSWLQVIGGLRYDRYELDGGNTSSSGNHLSPKLTVGISPVSWATVYGTFAEGYRAPSVTETLVAGAHPSISPNGDPLFTFVPNPNLRPEVGRNKEIGINFKHDGLFTANDKIRAKASFYRNDVDDYIELYRYGPPSCLVRPRPGGACVARGTYSLAQYRNVAQARLEGFEFESMYDAGRWFGGISAQTMRGRNLTADVPLATIPPDQVATTVGARFLDGRLTGMLRWAAVAAKEASDLPATSVFEPSKSFNLVNLYVGYQPSDDVMATFAVENLLNSQYEPYMNFLARPGVTVKAGLTVRFGG